MHAGRIYIYIYSDCDGNTKRIDKRYSIGAERIPLASSRVKGRSPLGQDVATETATRGCRRKHRHRGNANAKKKVATAEGAQCRDKGRHRTKSPRRQDAAAEEGQRREKRSPPRPPRQMVAPETRRSCRRRRHHQDKIMLPPKKEIAAETNVVSETRRCC